MATNPRAFEVQSYGTREPYVDSATVAAIQTVFNRLRLSHQSWESRQLHGRLDSRTVWRNDARGQVDIFKERRLPSPTKLDVHVLVDASGSMQGERACRAQDMAGTLVEAFKRIPTVRVHIWQHNATGAVTNVYRNYAPGLGTVGLTKMLQHIAGGNADGFALEAIGHRGLAAKRPDVKTLVIVVSDGLPSVNGHGATGDIHDHSTLVAQELRRKGVDVMAVAIAGADAAHRRMYGDDNVVKFTNDWPKLARDFGAVFARVLRKSGNR